ncbi:MAG: fluoride efflux transporter CrcB [Alphaproteobacteria bacterium]
MIAPIITIGFVALGGAIGAVARYGVNISATHLFGHGFPWGTLIVNILGSFLMGVAIVKLSQMQISPELRTMMITGFLGAFTTFSTFSLDTITLWERGDVMQAFLYIMASVMISITALFVALWLLKGSTL